MLTTDPIIRNAFRFLMLPLELRLYVYRYLGPNCLQENDQGIMKATRDGDHCYPSFLRVNKQMYLEGIPEFYGPIFYKAIIRPTGLYIHGERFCLRDPIHPSFRHIRMLDLTIRLPTGFPADTDDSGKNRQDRPQYGYSQLLNAAFDPNGSNSLQKLRCTIEVDYDVYRYFEFRLDCIPKILEEQLAPLKAIRGLSEVEFTTRNNCDTLFPGWEDILSYIDAYVNTIPLDVMLSRNAGCTTA